MPPLYEIKVHKINEHYWLIPYYEKDNRKKFFIADKWLSIRKIK